MILAFLQLQVNFGNKRANRFQSLCRLKPAWPGVRIRPTGKREQWGTFVCVLIANREIQECSGSIPAFGSNPSIDPDIRTKNLSPRKFAISKRPTTSCLHEMSTRRNARGKLGNLGDCRPLHLKSLGELDNRASDRWAAPQIPATRSHYTRGRLPESRPSWNCKHPEQSVRAAKIRPKGPTCDSPSGNALVVTHKLSTPSASCRW